MRCATELALDPLAHRADLVGDRARRVVRRAVDGLARRAARPRAPSAGSPATGRSLISAWRSHSRASSRVVAPPRRRATTRAGPASPTGAAACRPRRAGRAACAGGARRASAARGARSRRRRPRRIVVAVIDEHDVEVGGVAELAAAELAERRAPRACAPGGDRALGDAAPRRSRARCCEARLGDRGQLDAHRERIERAREVGEPDAQHVAVLDLGDRAPHRLRIARDRRSRAARRGRRATCARVRVGGGLAELDAADRSAPGVSTSVRARYALAPSSEPSRRAIAGCSSSRRQIDHASPRRAIRSPRQRSA